MFAVDDGSPMYNKFETNSINYNQNTFKFTYLYQNTLSKTKASILYKTHPYIEYSVKLDIAFCFFTKCFVLIIIIIMT